MKKIISLLLLTALLAAMAVPAAAAAQSFPDITDSRTAADVDALRMLGVLGGYTDGTFHPASNLTRAEFCAMAIRIMGMESQIDLYRSRTIFPDVRATHWAQGYVNLAVSGSSPIIAGMSDGTFRPDAAITYGQAVTILLRVLGYTDADAGMQWPDGYVALAAQTELNRDVGASDAYAPITRAQAARLFRNLLETEMKGGSVYAQMRGGLREDVIVFSVDGERIRTSDGAFAAAGSVIPASIIGKRGAMLLDNRSRVLTFLPDDSEIRTVTVSRCDSGRLTDTAGMKYPVTATTPVYFSDSESVYSASASQLTGSKVTLYLEFGSVAAIVQTSEPAAAAVVVRGKADAQTFAALTDGAKSYAILRNGVSASFAELQPYDVATYAGGVLSVSSLRISGICENVTGDTVTVSGVSLPLCAGAQTQVSSFLGKKMTALLTSGGAVAAAEDPKLVPVTADGLKELTLSDGGCLLVRDGAPAAIFSAETERVALVAARSEAAWLLASDGTRWTVPADAPVYTADGESNYAAAWMDIRSGTPVTLLRENGQIAAAVVWNESSSDAVVIRAAATESTFAALTGGKTGLTVTKNGQITSFSELKPYDVVTYAGGVLCVSDVRLTAQYENAYPSTVCPSEITVLGTKFELLPCAVDSASRFSIGSTVTLLLTADGRVAAVESADAVSANATAMVAAADESTVTLELLGCSRVLTVRAASSYASMVGSPASLTAAKKDGIVLNRLSGTAPNGDFLPAEQKIGTVRVASGASFYERVGKNGKLRALAYTELSGTERITAEEVTFLHLDSTGKADFVILDNITGDCYEYGFLTLGSVYAATVGGTEYYNKAAGVRNENGNGELYLGSAGLTEGVPVGIAGGSDGKLAGIVALRTVTGLARADFHTVNGETVLELDGVTRRVAQDVHCYNAQTGTWFSSLADARAFSNNLSACLDPVSQTVRVVIAN